MGNNLLILTKLNDDVTKYLKEKYKVTFDSDCNNILEKCDFYSLILIYSNIKKETLDFIKKIKSNQTYCYTPLIVLTNIIDPDFRFNALEIGAYDVISYAISNEKLSNRIDAVISRFMKPSSLSKETYEGDLKIYSRELFINECERSLKLDINRLETYYIIRISLLRYTMLSYTLGKEKMDGLLNHMGVILVELSREYDIAYGKGRKNEFYVLFDGKRDQVLNFIKEFDKKIKDKYIHENPDLVFGITSCSDYTKPVVEYMHEAEQASNEIVSNTVLNYNFYSEAIKEKLLLQEEYTSHFDDAIKNHEFIVYYQPKFDIINDTVVGAEALVRWKYDGNIVSPGLFIPIFEKNGNIAILDYYVWEEVCKYIAFRKENNMTIFPISVNVSRIFLTMSDFVEKLDLLCNKYDIDHSLLELEITETIFTDVKIIKAAVSKLREHGYKILMDDFGSGYSSLNVLKEIDFDILKIDMKFFSVENKKGLNIIKSVLDIANSMDVPAIAEGVETLEYVKLLREYGCNYVQGYYYSKPLPVNDFEEFIIKNISTKEKGKFVNFFHLNEAIQDFQTKTKNYVNVTKKDISKLMRNFLKELDVDSIVIAETSADNKIFEYTIEETIYPIKPVLGKQIEMTLGNKVSELHKGPDELITIFNENETPQVKCKKAMLFPITNDDILIGAVVFFRFEKDKEFTDEEKRAVYLLASVLSLPIYREHSSKVSRMLETQNEKLSYALEVLNEYKENVSYIQALFLNSLKKYPTICVKYKFRTHDGWKYTTDDEGHLIVRDSKDLKDRIILFASLIADAKEKELFEKAIKEKNINILPHSLDVFYDLETHKQTLSPRKMELNVVGYNDGGDSVFMCTIVDRTRDYEEFKKKENEANNVRTVFLNYLLDNFVTLSTYDIENNEIVTYYREGENYKTSIEKNADWITHRDLRLKAINDSKDKEKYIKDSTVENLKAMEVNKPINYNFSIGSNKDERYLSARLIVNDIEGRRIAAFLIRDITNEVRKENMMNHNLDVLADMVGKDQLTQLYNRNGLIENISDIREILQDGSDYHFLVFMDADLFKQINDKYGHDEGDKALTAIAKELASFAENHNGFAYRYGGDEFILIVNSKDEYHLIDALEHINFRLRNVTKKYLIKISYGIEMFSSKELASLNEKSLQEIIKKADSKLMIAKKEHKLIR